MFRLPPSLTTTRISLSPSMGISTPRYHHPTQLTSPIRHNVKPQTIPRQTTYPYTTTPPPPPHTTPTTPKKPKDSPFLIIHLLRESSPAVRWTIISAFALMAGAETTFWLKVIHSKFIADEDDGFWEKYLDFVKGVRSRWVGNYGWWFRAGIWGL